MLLTSTSSFRKAAAWRRAAQARRHVVLDWDVRQKSRFDATDSQGRALGVFLPRGTAVRGGDVLVAEDGSLVEVVAAPQPVLRRHAWPSTARRFDLLRAAYHLGNRHVPLELTPDHLKLEPDHVLADMLRAMHLIVASRGAVRARRRRLRARGMATVMRTPRHDHGTARPRPCGTRHGAPRARPRPRATGTTATAMRHDAMHASTAHGHAHDHAPSHRCSRCRGHAPSTGAATALRRRHCCS